METRDYKIILEYLQFLKRTAESPRVKAKKLSFTEGLQIGIEGLEELIAERERKNCG